MVVSAFLFETRGGALLGEFEPVSVSWSVQANQAETVNVEIAMAEPARRSGDAGVLPGEDLFPGDDLLPGGAEYIAGGAPVEWRNIATPWKHSICVEVGGRLFGGPIMPHDFDDDGARLKLTARGIRVALARFPILPVAALSQPLTTPDGFPDPTLDTSISGFDLGTIGKKITEQALAWPGWTDVPISFHADRVGTRERNYPAVDRKPVDEALTDLSGVQNGPDIRFQLVWTGPDSFGWVYESGTETQPRLQGTDVFAWEAGKGSGLRVTTNPTRMGSVSWSQGGRSNDTTLVRMLYDPYLVDRGFPLLHLESDASSNTTDPATLDAWNVETLRTARVPWEFWTFKVRADESPYPSDYNVGDLIDVVISADTPTAGGYIPTGVYRRRIAGLSGDEVGDWITITCGEEYGDG